MRFQSQLDVYSPESERRRRPGHEGPTFGPVSLHDIWMAGAVKDDPARRDRGYDRAGHLVFDLESEKGRKRAVGFFVGAVAILVLRLVPDASDAFAWLVMLVMAVVSLLLGVVVTRD